MRRGRWRREGRRGQRREERRWRHLIDLVMKLVKHKIERHQDMSLKSLSVPYKDKGRDAKTYERANNVRVKKILSGVKSLQNFTLFCQESEKCCDFALFCAIFWHILKLYVTFWHFSLTFGPFTLFCRDLDFS